VAHPGAPAPKGLGRPGACRPARVPCACIGSRCRLVCYSRWCICAPLPHGQADLPFASRLAQPLRVQLYDQFGFGVVGRSGGIAVFVQRVQDAVLTLDTVRSFKDDWARLSYLDRLSSLFTLMVQGACPVLAPLMVPTRNGRSRGRVAGCLGDISG
jgi:hypothetical protein